MIKRALVLLAAGLGFVASHAMAGDKMPAEASQAVKMSDAELDNVTAGSATVVLILQNPGKHVALPDFESNIFRCINCAPLGFEGAGGFVGVVTGSGKVIPLRPFGAAGTFGGL